MDVTPWQLAPFIVDLEVFTSDNFILPCYRQSEALCAQWYTMSLDGFFWYFAGDYSLESLLEMIALHLDATDAEYNTWRVFSSCFFKLSHYEQDCISACPPIKNDDGLGQHYSFSKTPKLFKEGMSGKSWRLRCRWWLTKHFSNSKLESEIEAGIYF